MSDVDATYDPMTQTVAADDGSRLSIWDCDVTGADCCPRCGVGELTYWTGGDGPDVAICLNRSCDFLVTRTAVPS